VGGGAHRSCRDGTCGFSANSEARD
jgi:hypothetical protein